MYNNLNFDKNNLLKYEYKKMDNIRSNINFNILS
jgi:hypothetical protein